MERAAECDVGGESWFLRRVLRQLVEKNREDVAGGKMIHKVRIYRQMSWLHRCGKQDTRTVMRQLAAPFDGVAWSNRGLRIKKNYLDSDDAAAQKKTTADSGGGAHGVEA